MLLAGSFQGNLGLFRLSWVRGRDDFDDDTGDLGSGLEWSSQDIQFALHRSRGLGHAWLGHFFLDAGACGVERFRFGFLMEHRDMMGAAGEPRSPI